MTIGNKTLVDIDTGASYGTYKSYAIGFLLSIAFTLLSFYLVAFFALPVARALYAHIQNQSIDRRNAARKRAAADALAAALAAVEDGRATAAARLRQEPVIVAPPTGEP